MPVGFVGLNHIFFVRLTCCLKVCKPHSMENMATLSFYQRVGKDNGLEFVEFVDPVSYTHLTLPTILRV